MKKEFAMSLSQSYRQDLLDAIQLAEQGMLSPSQQAYCFEEIEDTKGTALYPADGDELFCQLRTALGEKAQISERQRAEGELMLDGVNILSGTIDDCTLRSRVGMVFQRPTPFPMSIYDNIAYGIRLRENVSKSELDDRVEWALKKAALWNDVKDKLREPGTSLSGGQQQRLCIARGIAVKPEVLLLDEPCSALDPISTARIEELIEELKNDYTVVIVTHSMQQAARVSDYTAFLYLGELIEAGPTADIFTRPQKKATEDYITGRFG